MLPSLSVRASFASADVRALQPATASSAALTSSASSTPSEAAARMTDSRASASSARLVRSSVRTELSSASFVLAARSRQPRSSLADLVARIHGEEAWQSPSPSASITDFRPKATHLRTLGSMSPVFRAAKIAASSFGRSARV